MNIGILEAGEPPPDLLPRFGRYDAMFAKLLGPGFPTSTYEVRAGRYPASPEEQDAYIITGSAAGVYEDHDWIPPLRAFLQSAKGKAKLLGICFGHQIMAEAFGGRVERCQRGWGIGLLHYDVHERAEWMDAETERFGIPVSHQDQIVEQPPSSRILAGSAFNPFGLIEYQDQPAISFQCHPEFDTGYAKALIETRRDRVPGADAAIASLDQPNDRERITGWIRAFLQAPR